MNICKLILNIFLILVLCVSLSSCAFLFWITFGLESYCPWNPYIDTVFPKSFIIDNLDKVEVGMEKSNVIELIGEPLSIHKSRTMADNENYYYSENETYYYSEDGKAKIGDWAWLQIRIQFQDNVVTDIYIRWAYD
jgi:outer membrane protein assembly factor BamE (lipoprotein component of BamABCDE complex)